MIPTSGLIHFGDSQIFHTGLSSRHESRIWGTTDMTWACRQFAARRIICYNAVVA